ncbi:MAG TPA: oligosaccharide flippase family protein [Candidatus Saccharimonadales bacterium]|nr:oligosaccharide flippase family protein [Candidatus Saccharimonadales bacterium]
MEQRLKRLGTSTFVRHNAIFFIGALAIGFLNYLYYPVLGRLLQPGSFGELQALVSIFTQIAIFLSVLGLMTVTIVTNYSNNAQRNRVIVELEKLSLLLVFGLVAATVLSANMLKHFFQFHSTAPFLVLAFAIAASVPLMFRSSYLRGRQHFGLAAWIGVIASAADLVLAAALVLAGWGTTGAITGLLLGQAIACGVAIIWARRQGFTAPLYGSVRLPNVRLIAPELRYALLVFISSLVMTAMYSIDTVVVKHYFDSRTAGLYAGIATVARIVFFLSASVGQVLLPTVRLDSPVRHNQLVLFKSLLLLSAIGGSTLVIFALLPRMVIGLLMGGTYLRYAGLLPRLSLVIFLVSLLNLFVTYHLALRHYAIGLVVILGSIVTYAQLRAHHQTLPAVINSLLYGCLAMFAAVGLWLSSVKLRYAYRST